jgi:hypothetical protein
MSTKTLRKRIALVAVAGLGFGLLSTTTASALEATGINVYPNGGSATTSRGIVTSANAAALTTYTTTAGTNAIKMVASGSLYVSTGLTGGANVISVAGGTITSCVNGDASTVTLSPTGTSCISGTAGTPTDKDLSVTVVPNVGTSALVISQLNATATAEAHRVTVSIVAATTVGAFSASKSDIHVYSPEETEHEDGTLNVDLRYADGELLGGATKALSGSTTTVLNGNTGAISFTLKDGNDNDLSSATTGVTATATGGCVVGFSSATAIGTAATDVAQTGDVTIKKITANAPAKCVVTLAVNGAVVSTKTFTFQGQVTKLAVSDVVIAASGADTVEAFFVDAQDSAGNSIPGVSIANGGSLTGSVSNITTASTTFADGGALMTVSCVAKGLVSDLKVATTNASAATIYSDAFSMQCSGSPVNYTASLDKASYTIGEVATLTITAKDSAGNLTWDGATLADPETATTATNTAVSIAGGPLIQVGAIVSTDSFSSGVKKYKFTVGGISSGSFQLVVDLPNLNSSTYSQAAQTVAYKVTTGADGGVQLADVLKAIVSLIASINKQIAALQKALLKK